MHLRLPVFFALPSESGNGPLNYLPLWGDHYFQTFTQTLGSLRPTFSLPPLILIFCQFLWPLLTSIALCLASWLQATPVHPLCTLLEDVCQLRGFFHRIAWWKLSHIKSKPLCPWLWKAFILWPHSTSLSPLHPSTCNVWSPLPSIGQAVGYVLGKMSSLTLACSKHIQLLPTCLPWFI